MPTVLVQLQQLTNEKTHTENDETEGKRQELEKNKRGNTLKRSNKNRNPPAEKQPKLSEIIGKNKNKTTNVKKSGKKITKYMYICISKLESE